MESTNDCQGQRSHVEGGRVLADSKIKMWCRKIFGITYDEASNMCTRPIWVETSRGRLAFDNYRYLRQLSGDSADLLAVVKANAYGHGLEQCAPILSNAGAEWLASPRLPKDQVNNPTARHLRGWCCPVHGKVRVMHYSITI